jgi:hypothetical protein
MVHHATSARNEVGHASCLSYRPPPYNHSNNDPKIFHFSFVIAGIPLVETK